MTKANPTLSFQPDSLVAQVVAFFQNNPDEELDLEAISEKFDATRGNIHSQLAKGLEAKALNRVKNDEGEYIYTAGTEIPKKPVQKIVDIDAVNRLRMSTKPTLALPSVGDVQIDDDIPLLSGRAATKQDWTPLLTKLKVGQSFALPQRAKAILTKNITDLHKSSDSKFTTRLLKAEQQIRCWRTA